MIDKEGAKWYLVRRAKEGTWHPAVDNASGAEKYGVPEPEGAKTYLD